MSRAEASRRAKTVVENLADHLDAYGYTRFMFAESGNISDGWILDATAPDGAFINVEVVFSPVDENDV